MTKTYSEENQTIKINFNIARKKGERGLDGKVLGTRLRIPELHGHKSRCNIKPRLSLSAFLVLSTILSLKINKYLQLLLCETSILVLQRSVQTPNSQ